LLEDLGKYVFHKLVIVLEMKIVAYMLQRLKKTAASNFIIIQKIKIKIATSLLTGGRSKTMFDYY
jgi:hypothetical protein